MTQPNKTHVIFAVALTLAACGGSDRVNNTQPAATSAPLTTANETSGSTGTLAPVTENSPSVNPSATASAVPPASPAPAPALPVYREVSVPAGTRLPLELMTTVSSETSAIESAVQARLTDDVVVKGITAIPSGTMFSGVVTAAERAGRVKGRSRIAFRFTTAEIRGTSERLRTNAVSRLGQSSTKGDAARIGGGAVAGAVIGGLLGGGKGAAEGAAIGGGAGTGVVLATRGKEVTIGRGATVTATLADPVVLQVPR